VAELEERTRALLRHADWLEALDEFAAEGHALAHELTRAEAARLRETGEHVRRAADYADAARTAIRLADRALLGRE
jgi:hypothetical protein